MSRIKTGMKRFLAVGILAAAVLVPGTIFAQATNQPLYLPSGYGMGQNAEGTGFNVSTGYTKVGNSYYLNVSPLIELPFFFDMRLGLQIPLEILVYDGDKTGQKIPSLRKGTFDESTDYLKMIAYVRKGTHLYFNPDDSFNWSFFYGKMTDGYIGHRTIISRYVSTYDPTIYRAGFMFDINNNWGGIEAFRSDMIRNEVVAGRVYIRPFGIYHSVHDLFANNGTSLRSQIALSRTENRDPERNGGVFFQERIPGGQGGRIGQQFLNKIGEDYKEDDKHVEFREVTDPVTGETQVRAVPVEGPAENRQPGQQPGPGQNAQPGQPAQNTQPGQPGQNAQPGQPGQEQPAQAQEERSSGSSEKWGTTFLSRWALGYTVVRDSNAPLTLEKDGSGNLVVDPETNRPRGDKTDNLTFIGYDTEFRLSPAPWLDLTLYTDVNKIKDFDKSEGLHVGLDTGFRISNLVRFTFRPEYRELSSNYIPVYFDSYYSLERTVYNPGGTGSGSGTATASSQTKLEYLKSLGSAGPKVKGGFAEMRLDVLQIFVLDANYEDYAGPNNSKVFVGFYVPISPYTFGLFADGYYSKKGFDRLAESFKYDDRSLAAVEFGYSFFAGLYIKVGYQRTWVYDGNTSTYVAQDQRTVNFGFMSKM